MRSLLKNRRGPQSPGGWGASARRCCRRSRRSSVSATAHAAKKNPDTLPETKIQDLHYGDVLFYFYQEDDFEAITRLNAYEQWGLLSHHHDESQLLLGGLYLSLGLHNEAGKRFEAAADSADAGRRAQSRLVLSREGLVRPRLPRSRGAGDPPGAGPSAAAARSREAASVRQHPAATGPTSRKPPVCSRTGKVRADWMAYAQFNLGVAYVRDGKLAEADAVPRRRSARWKRVARSCSR